MFVLKKENGLVATLDIKLKHMKNRTHGSIMARNKIQKKVLILFLIVIIQIVAASANAKNSFFDQSYRGWLWFEEKAQRGNSLKPTDKTKFSHPTKEEMQKARRDNEIFKEELDDLRAIMIRHPENLDYIRLYKKKEKLMLDGAMVLTNNFMMVNFLNPDIADQLNNPQNIYGRNIDKEEKKKSDFQKIKSLTSKVEIFVFRSGSCAHCHLLEKHLSSFAIKYGFQVEAVSEDGSDISYFKTYNNPEIIKQLKLNIMPTVIAITRDSKQRFELARGAVSIPDLEDKALLLVEILDNQEKGKINE